MRTFLLRALLFPCIPWGCGGQRALLDDSEWLTVGVEPLHEASALAGGLERAGYRIVERLEGPRWVAFDARRDPELRAIRIVTPRGTAVALDSHESDGVRLRHGRIELIAPSHPLGHDLDGDGQDEIVIGAWHGEQRCLLPFRITTHDEAQPLVPVLDGLGANTCVEAIRDVDENGRVEGIAALRLVELARAEIPMIEAPLELDERGRFRVGLPPIRFVTEERERRALALQHAVHAIDLGEVYRLAIELAALARLAGGTRDAQLDAFDRAIASVAWTEEFARDLRIVREHIERGWPTTSSD